jgi:peroxiredoxin
MIESRDKVYNFSLPGIFENGETGNFELKKYEGKTVLLYFYSLERAKKCINDVEKHADVFSELKDTVCIWINVAPLKDQVFIKQKYMPELILLEDAEWEVSDMFTARNNNRESSLGHVFILGKDRRVIRNWRDIRLVDTLPSILYCIEGVE